MTLVLATGNPGKSAELRELLLDVPALRIQDLRERGGISLPQETGSTLEENARQKAEAVARGTGSPALADDSGLFVPALGGAPGVRSARFAGAGATDRENVAKLLDLLAGHSGAERRASFRCVLCYARPEGSVEFFRGEVEGSLLTAPRGGSGFGYDPIFLFPPMGKTFAELPASVKNRVSHRGLAVLAFRDALIGGALAPRGEGSAPGGN